MRATLTLVLALIAPAAFGNTDAHTDVYVIEENDKLTTNGFGCPDETCASGVVLETRVFTETLSDNFAERNPGFRALGGNLPGDLDVSWDFLPMTVDSGPHAGHTSTLLYWDGQSAGVDFGPAPGVDYGFLYQGRDNAFAVADTGDQLVPGAVAFQSEPAGSTHTHGGWLVDSTGDPFDGVNETVSGVYLAALQLRADTLETSDPFYILVRTDDPLLAPSLALADAWVDARVDTLAAVSAGLAGDFNADGVVDGADYTAWRDGFAAGTLDAAGYAEWVGNFGAVASSGAAAPVSVPEPGTLVGLLAGVAGLAGAASPRAGARRTSRVGRWS